MIRELRSWLFLILGLLLATLTGMALYGVAQEYGTRQVASAAETVPVVTAKTDIPARTVLAADQLTRRAYPKALAPIGAVSAESEAIGQTTLAAISSGAAILRAQLVAAGGSRGASATLDKGKVLVAFPTADPLTAASLVQIGDHVDILATLTGPGDTLRRTQTIVQNLEVIDVVGGGRDGRVPSLTFVVDHQTALVLKYLRDSQATIDIAVRSRTEGESASTNSVDLGYLQQTYGIRR